jgi:predicted lipoprotein with Yx(FWY)xxD motif
VRVWFIRRPLVLLTVLVVAGALAAGCGGNNSGSGGSSSGGGYGGGPTTSGGQAATSTVAATSTKLGTILVDGSGRTLYLFERDQPNQSSCSGGCAAAWPPAKNSGTPKAGSGANASMLSTIKRGDGSTQVTYNRHPLYYYSGDSGPRQQNGQGLNAFGALWYVVAPGGSAVV